MNVLGIPQGMGLFHVSIGGGYTTKDGWSGSLSQRYPTFFVVGGNVHDAIKNAQTVIGPDVIASADYVQINVSDADPNGTGDTACWNSSVHTVA